MNTSEVDQAQPLLQPQEDDIESQNKQQDMEVEVESRSIDIRQAINNFKQLKSFDILKSALAIFTSNTKLMFLIIVSTIPFFVFLNFYEIRLQKAIFAAPHVLETRLTPITMSFVELSNGSSIVTRSPSIVISNGSSIVTRSPSIVISNGFSIVTRSPSIDDNSQMAFLYRLLQLCLLYVVLYPLLELLSMTTTIQIAAKVYAGEKPNTFKDVFYRKNNLKGVLITYGYVHFLSFLTLVGLSWIIWNHLIFTDYNWYQFHDSQTLDLSYCLYVLSIAIHTIFFVALLYKYTEWSAFWNMTIVISVLEEESGLDAFGITNYYGKHCKPTGFQLMLWFVGLNIALRLPCLFVNGFGPTSVVMGLICLANLVKWVAFVLYYFDCKQQTMEKKNDVEIGKAASL